MNKRVIRIPGKVMIAGEYSVLRGGDALSFTLDRFMDIHIHPGGPGWVVESDFWPEPKIWALEQSSEPAMQVLDLFYKSYGLPASGGMITVRSDLDPKFGFGSSSALRLGILYGLHGLMGHSNGDLLAAHDAFKLQCDAQPDASGYDILTQWQGGVLRYLPSRPWPGRWSRIGPKRLEDFVQIWVGGPGAPTAAVMKDRLAWLGAQRGRWERMVQVSQSLVSNLGWFLELGNNTAALLRDIEAHRAFFASAPHEPEWFHELNGLPGIGKTWSYKATGAGGEDALLLFGKGDETLEFQAILKKRGWYPMPYSVYNRSIQEGSTCN